MQTQIQITHTKNKNRTGITARNQAQKQIMKRDEAWGPQTFLSAVGRDVTQSLYQEIRDLNLKEICVLQVI